MNEYNIKEIRKKVIDYYGSAMPFYSMSIMEIERCEKMSDEEIIEEAIKLNIIKNDNYVKTYRRY